jgi:hypothetical protein
MHAPESFVFMFKDSDWFAKVFVGALAITLAWTGIGALLLFGYLIHAIRGQTEGRDVLPEWSDWRRMLRDGTAFLITTLLLLSPFIAGVVLAGSWLVRIIAIVAVALLIPAAALNTARREHFAALFRRSTVILMARNIHRTAAAACVVAASCCLGWLSLVIGWPIVIFWSFLVSTSMIAKMHS